jgi:D-beta-D-heptose 7-phosphate kinase/D-beta-D-heptose 1-phosphate adenosyltransferase
MNPISPVKIREIVNGMASVGVMVIGDVMLDRYVWGLVSRISPEAPVPIVDVHDETSRLGGAANVATNVTSLGARCRLVGVVGDDALGRDLAGRAARLGVTVDGLVVDPGRPTTVKTRVIAHNQQVVRTDKESRAEAEGAVQEEIVSCALKGLSECDAVIVSDYGKGVISKDLLEKLIPAVRAEGKIITVDPKETHFRNYRRVSLITPNQFEAGGAMGRRIEDEKSLLEVGWEIMRLLESDALLITQGADGMSLFEKDGGFSHFPTAARKVYDVTGAGDTVISAFTLALSAGATMAEAAQLANHAAGIVIREVGTASAGPEELIESFSGKAEGES